MKRIPDFTVYGYTGIMHIPAYLIPPAPEHKGLQLVVHKAIGTRWRGQWNVAEKITSRIVGHGSTRAAAIENAIHELAKRTPRQIMSAMKAATQHIADMGP